MSKINKDLKKAVAAETRLLSKPEVLDRVGVTYPTIWAWMRDGKFPPGRELGGRTCWKESEVNAWMEARPTRVYGARYKQRAACNT
jgi:predicted DNA-binding transcriptional regulator AlpA